MMPTDEDLDRRFGVRRLSVAESQSCQSIRDWARGLAGHIVSTTPPSREQSLSLTALQEAVMWANAAIAHHEP